MAKAVKGEGARTTQTDRPQKADVKPPRRPFRSTVDAFRADRRLLYLFYGFVFFLIVTLGVTAYAVSYEVENFPSFWLSLTASFWEDLTFFLMLGGVAALLTLNRPGDEGFDSRVRYFFNGRHVTDGSRKHIADEMKRLGIFSPRYQVCLTVTDYDAKIGAVKTTFQVDRTVVNMFKDQSFDAEEHSYLIEPDELDVEVCGELLDVYRGEGLRRIHEPGTPKAFGVQGVRDSVCLKLHEDESVLFGFRAWMWFKVGEAYGVKPSRYTEEMEVRIVNDSCVTLSLETADKEAVLLTTGTDRTYVCSKVSAGSSWVPFVLTGVTQ
ncbi:MAG TPA: hypothetical protein VGR32_10130 [Brevundimonas sp.]|jgi:hypothetical protein|uniref:hypothetical protein n=1 Tax=Brevundimonas sp. TaxID=1871086 RepID=UPI002DF1AD30|nr:hypothetical protein [Brevundimonas sp.]